MGLIRRRAMEKVSVKLFLRTSLTELVNNLQIRIGNLEAGHMDPQSRKLSNLSSHDEGVDLSEISKESFYQDGGESSKCPFYDDCVCTPHADQFTNLIIECSSTTD